jgi:hypothetical protein
MWTIWRKHARSQFISGEQKTHGSSGEVSVVSCGSLDQVWTIEILFRSKHKMIDRNDQTYHGHRKYFMTVRFSIAIQIAPTLEQQERSKRWLIDFTYVFDRKRSHMPDCLADLQHVLAQLADLIFDRFETTVLIWRRENKWKRIREHVHYPFYEMILRLCLRRNCHCFHLLILDNLQRDIVNHWSSDSPVSFRNSFQNMFECSSVRQRRKKKYHILWSTSVCLARFAGRQFFVDEW